MMRRRTVRRVVGLGFALFAALIFTAMMVLAMGNAAHAAVMERDSCDWRKPGHNPYTGNVPAAVQRYTQMPQAVRDRLQARMERRAWDDHVLITADRITGQRGDYSDLREMHFGPGWICHKVDRSKWSMAHKERALIYCDSGWCVAVPSVCRNVSIITAPGTTPPAPDSGSGLRAQVLDLFREPPGAGGPSSAGTADQSPPPAGVLLPQAGAATDPGGVGGDQPPGAGPTGGPGGIWWPLGPGVIAYPVAGGGQGGGPELPTPLPAVPEPNGAWLAGSGLLGLIGWAWWRRRREQAEVREVAAGRHVGVLREMTPLTPPAVQHRALPSWSLIDKPTKWTRAPTVLPKPTRPVR